VPVARPVLILVLCLVTSAARGAPETPEQKAAASAHLKRGAELIDAEDLAGALSEFQAAYRLVPDPSILHNFGVVYQGLGRNAEALDAFERFLAEASRPPAAVRERAVQAVRTLREQVAVVRVASRQPSADILVDGRHIGQTPRDQPIYLDPGPHQLSIGAAYSERLEVAAGQRLTVPAAQEAAPPAPPAVTPVMLAQSPARDEPPREWQRPAAWATAAAALAAAGLFGIELALRHRDVTRFNEKGCGSTYGDKGGPDCASLLARAHREETGALVSGVAAGLLGAGAAALFLTLPRSGVSLSASSSQLGLRLQGDF
jgi:tetratricopeptide (TPR) repeat protein